MFVWCFFGGFGVFWLTCHRSWKVQKQGKTFIPFTLTKRTAPPEKRDVIVAGGAQEERLAQEERGRAANIPHFRSILKLRGDGLGAFLQSSVKSIAEGNLKTGSISGLHPGVSVKCGCGSSVPPAGSLGCGPVGSGLAIGKPVLFANHQ